MKWYHPTLTDLPWAQKILAERDRRLASAWYRHMRINLNAMSEPSNHQALLEHWLMKYVESGDRAWLKLAKDSYERHLRLPHP